MYKYSTCIYILVQFEVAYKYCHYTAPIMRYMHYNITISIQLTYIFLFNQRLHTKIAISPCRDDK